MSFPTKPSKINPDEFAQKAAKDGPPASRGSLLVIFLTVFIDLLGFGMVLPLLPIYAKSFGLKEAGWEIGLLMSSFSAMTFIFAPLWGRLSDRIGKHTVLIVGLMGSVGFYILFGIATVFQSMLLLFVARIGAGIAGATIPAAQAYIADVTSLQNRAKGMALIGAAFGLGFTFGPLLGAAALVFFHRCQCESLARLCRCRLCRGLHCSWPLCSCRNRFDLTPVPAGHALHRWTGVARRFGNAIGPRLARDGICQRRFVRRFETTLSLLLNDENLAFKFKFHQVLLY